MLHFSSNSFTSSLTCYSPWRKLCSPLNTDVCNSNNDEPIHTAGSHTCCGCLGKPASPHVYFCIIMSAGILEHTVSVLNGNWSTTAVNRRIKCETGERCQSEAYTCVTGRLMGCFFFFSVKCKC